MSEILNYLLVCLVPVLSYQEYSFYFCTGFPNLTIFGALTRLGLISNVSSDIGRLCS